eukprot:comp7075_c0_seq1/m.2816 comp7075_c0_seq1/g.2816  ORF comp7075_c0_seq1/g.2816 comp7075_c0_seq1/m.2816 type:complete len:304 (-) comp7075_c0_seq1:748-1659(-)
MDNQQLAGAWAGDSSAIILAISCFVIAATTFLFARWMVPSPYSCQNTQKHSATISTSNSVGLPGLPSPCATQVGGITEISHEKGISHLLSHLDEQLEKGNTTAVANDPPAKVSPKMKKPRHRQVLKIAELDGAKLSTSDFKQLNESKGAQTREELDRDGQIAASVARKYLLNLARNISEPTGEQTKLGSGRSLGRLRAKSASVGEAQKKEIFMQRRGTFAGQGDPRGVYGGYAKSHQMSSIWGHRSPGSSPLSERRKLNGEGFLSSPLRALRSGDTGVRKKKGKKIRLPLSAGLALGDNLLFR